MQLVSQQIYFQNKSSLMLHGAKFVATSNLSRGWDLSLNSKFLFGCSTKNIDRQVGRGMLYCAMAGKCVAALWQSLRKIEPDSTLCNASCNKNVA